jgi:hypothetical protein
MKTLKNKRRDLIVFTLVLGLVLSVSAVLAKKPITGDVEIVTEGRARSIIVTPDYDLRVDVWTDKSTYFAGEDIRIYFYVNKDSYVYIFDTDTNGTTRQIFPNYYDTDNFVRGGHTYSIPDYNYHLEVTGPTGREYLRAIAIGERYPFLREHDRFKPSDPFPRYPGGVDSFKQKLESMAPHSSEAYREESGERLKRHPGELSITPRPVRPVPRYREYAESYTSFYVRSRWYFDDDDPYRYNYKTEKIKFKSIPDDADLYIDGRYYGKTSKKVRLSHGPHVIRMRRRGYYDWVRSVYVDDYTDDTIIARLRRSRSHYWEPYRKEWDLHYKDWRHQEKEKERDDRELGSKRGSPREELDRNRRKKPSSDMTVEDRKRLERSYKWVPESIDDEED